jgi:hypothetical protein
MAIASETPDQGRSGLLSGFAELDRILRGELTRVSSLERGHIEITPGRLSVIIVVLGMIYGLCMGCFALFRMDRTHAFQLIASMVKVPLLFYLTLLVTLPSLYVFNALVGSRLTLSALVRLLVASLGVMMAVLASLGPIVAFFSMTSSATTASYHFMVLFNVVVFGVSGTLGLLFLLQTLHRLSVAGRAASRPAVPATPSAPSESESEPVGAPSAAEPAGALDRLDNRVLSGHVKTVFRLWVIVFALVGSQMSWVLRPFVGNPAVPFTWLRVRESNFFQAVLEHLHKLFS